MERSPSLIIPCALALAVFLRCPAAAQPSEAVGWRWEAAAAFGHEFEADADDFGWARDADVAALELNGAGRLGGTFLTASLGYGRWDFDWSPGDTSAPAPFVAYDQMETAGLDLAARRTLAGDWGTYLRGGYQWSRAESGGGATDWSDGGRGFLALGASRAFSRSFSAAIGMLAVERLEEDALVVPFLVIDWRINDQWRLRTANGVFLLGDLRRDRRHVLTFGVEWESLSAPLPLPSTAFGGIPADGIGSAEEEGIKASLGYDWAITPHFVLQPWIEYRFAREIEYRALGRVWSESDLDASFTVGLRLQARF